MNAESPNDTLEIEALIESIRKSIIDKELMTNPLQQSAFSHTSAEKIPTELFENLLAASRINNSLQQTVQMHKPRLPIIGGLVDWVRRQAHQLVVYYVGNAVERQNKINTHLLKSAFLLGQYYTILQSQPDPLEGEA
ncbi:MAG: hypothetical protein ACPG8W_17785 [Candidatus Promineifilaceae bacterium]